MRAAFYEYFKHCHKNLAALQLRRLTPETFSHTRKQKMTDKPNDEIIEATPIQVKDAALCLHQSLKWMHQCYALGAVAIEEADEIAAAMIRRMTATGQAHIEARMNLSQQTCTFFFCHDAAGEGAEDMELMTIFFKPPGPARHQH